MNNLFKPGELISDQEVEAMETGQVAGQTEPAQPPPPQEPTGSEQPPPEQAEKTHQEAVPYDRLQEAIAAKNALEQELAQHREFRTRLEERQRLIQEANDQAARIAAEQRRVSERPDPALDPVGAELWDMRAELNQQRNANQQLQSQLQQFGQTYQSGQEQRAFSDWVTDTANRYSQTVDQHYFPAARYCADRRMNFWRAVAPRAPKELAEQIVQGESVMIARLNQQYGNGEFPQAVAQLAREWGYNPQAQNGNGQNGNGVPSRPPSPQQQRLQQVQNGQRLTGLGNVPAAAEAGGATRYRNMGPSEIQAIPEPEFMRLLANPVTARDLKYAMARAQGFEDGETPGNW